MNFKIFLLLLHIAHIATTDEHYVGDSPSSLKDAQGGNYSVMYSGRKCVDIIRDGRPQSQTISFDLTSTFRGRNMKLELAASFSNHISIIGGILLNSAVAMGRMDLVKDLINIGSRLDVPDISGITPLFRALEMDNIELALILTTCGADVNFSYGNNSLLHKAVERGSVSAIEGLVNLGATIDTENSEGYSPLFLAMKMRRNDVIETLLSKGASADFKTSSGTSLLHRAVMENDFETTKEIIQLGVDIDAEDNRGHSPLYTAVRLNYSEIIEELLRNGASVNHVSADGNPILHTAVAEGLMHVVSRFIQLGANVSLRDSKGMSPLYRAIDTGNIDLLLRLMEFYDEMEAVVPSSGDYPIHYAVRKGSLRSCIILLEQKNAIYPNKDGLTPFVLAVYLNQSTIIDYFLKNRDTLERKLNYPIFDGNKWFSPLHLAVKENNLKAAENLIRYGAFVNHKDKKGITPLLKAVESNNSAMIDLLLLRGANASYKVRDTGDSLLHIAVKNQCVKCVELLIKSGADVNALGEGCLTPLLLAVIENNEDIMKILFSKGANVNFEPRCTIPPIIITQENGGISNFKIALELIDSNDRAFLTQKAVEVNKPEVLRYLIGNTTVLDPQKRTLMMRMAVKRGNVEAMNVLMKLGMYKTDSKGTESLLSLALENRQPKAMETLIKYGADINFIVQLRLTTPMGVVSKPWSLLHQASFINGVKEAEVLLDNGMDVNIRDKVLWTPLHVAAMGDSVQIGQLLIDRGADVDAKTLHGYTPLYVAQSTNATKMKRLLSICDPNRY